MPPSHAGFFAAMLAIILVAAFVYWGLFRYINARRDERAYGSMSVPGAGYHGTTFDRRKAQSAGTESEAPR